MRGRTSTLKIEMDTETLIRVSDKKSSLWNTIAHPFN
jgi:hypothetical protein